MVLQLGSLRDALLEAGASPDKANKAAEEAAGYDNRMVRVEADVSVIKTDVADIKVSLKSIDARLNNGERSDVLLRWMVGLLYPLIIALLLKMLNH